MGWALAAIAAFAAPLGAADSTIVFLGAEDSPSWRGAQLGLVEANLQGKFLGARFVIVREPSDGAVAVVATAQGLEKALASTQAPVINISDRDDALRRDCKAHLLHAIPSEAMLADARQQWRKAHPDDASVDAHAWHSEAYKFAARDLNKRFRAQHGSPMDDESWAAWAAVRLVADAVFRTQSSEPAEILRYLREESEFDGNKGPAHSFRPTGQLRQPLMITVDGKLAGEAPVRGAADPNDLDSLGLQACSSQ